MDPIVTGYTILIIIIFTAGLMMGWFARDHVDKAERDRRQRDLERYKQAEELGLFDICGDKSRDTMCALPKGHDGPHGGY